jgi:hypothetical protein
MAMAMATDPPAVVNNYARGSGLIRASRARGGAGTDVSRPNCGVRRKSALVL